MPSPLVFESMRADALMAQAGRAEVVVAEDPTMHGHGDGALSDEESDVIGEGSGVGKV